MHAIRQHAFGPPEHLRYEEVADPEPGPGQVRVAVAAAGVHAVDTQIRAGVAGGPFPLPELPMTPGREVAGLVDAVGADVDDAWVGRRVVVHLGQASGGYAERAVANVTSLHELPDGVAYDVAVAMIGTGRTTMAVLEVADLGPDDVVLVTGATGGMGALLVQAAAHAGATVTALAGGRVKVDQARRLGASAAVDYREPDWPAAVAKAVNGRDVTVVFDAVGGDLGRQAFELLGPGGRIVLYGYSSGTPTQISASDLFARSLTATAAIGPRIFKRPGGIRDLEERALAEAAAGRLVPLVHAFALADAPAAHIAIESRTSVGKVVLIPSD